MGLQLILTSNLQCSQSLLNFSSSLMAFLFCSSSTHGAHIMGVDGRSNGDNDMFLSSCAPASQPAGHSADYESILMIIFHLCAMNVSQGRSVDRSMTFTWNHRTCMVATSLLGMQKLVHLLYII
jgi:hypothetical protein